MKIIKIICYSILVFIFSYSIIEFTINRNLQDYKIELSQSNPNYINITKEDYWNEIISYNSYDETYGITMDLFDTMSIEDGYLIIDGKGLSYEGANKLLRSLVNKSISSSDGEFMYNYSTEIINRVNPIIIPFILMSISIVLLSFIIVNKEEEKYTIYSKEYWKAASRESKVIKNLCMMSLILSIQIVVAFIPIPSGFGTLGLSLGYLFQSINCLLFGPINALVIGALGDLIGHVLMPQGTFFFGYTLNAMLACLTYGLCFYKTRITFTKVLLSRIFINFFVNAVLGTLWSAMLFNHTFEMAYTNFLFINLPKNVVYLIPQSLLLFFVLKSMVKLFYSKGYIEEYQTKITII